MVQGGMEGRSPASAGEGIRTGETVGGQGLCRVLKAASIWLDAHVEDVNALNVFPVPDGDTGTNMSLTMRAALDELGGGNYASASDLMHDLAHGALMGARGNSGVILSQILRGFARSIDGHERLGARDLSEALREAADTAYKGVMKPVEGTMLTVIREAADEAQAVAIEGEGLAETLETTLAAAKAALERTPSLLPVLAEAGVVDAGGKGLVLLLEGIVRSMRGESLEAEEAVVDLTEEHTHPPDGRYNYDTQFVIQGADLDVLGIRERIAAMGDSVLVVGDHQNVKVHVHSDHPGEALEYGLTQGQVAAVIIENMQLQYEEFKKKQEGGVAAPMVPVNADRPTSEIGLVAVASGTGIEEVLQSLGVAAIVPGGQTMNPSTQDLLSAIEQVASDKIILLPNNNNIVLAAQQAAELSDKQIAVVPTHTVPEGIAALLSFNYQADLKENAEIMARSADQVRTIEITRAVRSAQVNGLMVQEGQFIGLLDGDLVTAGDSVLSVVEELFEHITVEQYEIVTVYYGEDESEAQAQELSEAIATRFPSLEVETLNGGQAHYNYIISAE